MTPEKYSAIKHYFDYFRNGDRREIFKLLVDNFRTKNAIYPGSFIDISPSFYIPITVYIDSFKKTNKFFNDKSIYDFISKNRRYKNEPVIRYHNANYNSDFGEKDNNFDLLISLYAGFISQFCKKYLKKSGIFLVNNSHGDASMAYLDKDFKFIAAIYRSNQQYWLTQKNLEKYFIPKKREIKVTRDYLNKIQRGVGYTKSASAYVFKKIKE
jgi:hypothetical protein